MYTHFGELYRYLQEQDLKEDFLHHRREGVYNTVSKEAFLTSVRYLTLAFYDRGYKGKQIAVAITPCVHWLMIDYALMICGAVSVPVFMNISATNLHFELLDADIKAVFIENKEQEKVIWSANEQIEIFYVEQGVDGHLSLQDLIEKGRHLDVQQPSVFDTLIYQIAADDLVTIVYTSGTSGLPKGVELTHKNLLSQIDAASKLFPLSKTNDVALSFLPLAHIFERMVMHFYLSREVSVYFADDVKNVGVLLKEVNPTVMTVVPRLLEKVLFKMKEKAMQGNFVKKLLVNAAFNRALEKNPSAKKNLLDRVFDNMVYSKLRLAFGSRMAMIISGGAPLSDRLYRFYLNIGIPIYQGYGQTEASPVICTNSPQYNKIGTCGKAFFGVEVKLSDEGELLAKGANIMRGYHNNTEATKEVIDTEGWLHTGDLAEIDARGYISITGRKKEQFKTSTGEYVGAVYIEQELKSNGWFEHVLIVGQNKPFVVALLFVEPEFLGRLAKEMKSTPSKALESAKLERMVARYIDAINVKLNHWEKIRRFKVIADTPTVEKGQITPSMKLVKRQLLQDYREEITLMYKDHI